MSDSQSSSGFLSIAGNLGARGVPKWSELGARSREFRWPRGPLKRVLVSLAYVSLFVGLHGLTVQSQVFPEISPWNLSAGLSLGFLLGYGLGYLPAVFISHVFSSLYLSSPNLTPMGILALSLSLSAAYALAAIAVGRLAADPWIEITNRRTLCAFVLLTPPSAVLASVALFVNLAFADVVEIEGLTSLILLGSAGNVTGIILLAPLMILSGRWLGPWLSQIVRARTPVKSGRERPLKSYIWRVGVLSAILVLFLYFIYGFSVTEGFSLFCLVSLPLVAGSLAFGLDGVASVLALVGFVAISRTEAGYGADISHQIIFVAAAVNSMAMGLLVTERQRQQFTMSHQTALIDSVSFATGHLFGMTDQEKNVNEVLRHLATEANLDGVYVLENRQDAGDPRYPVLYELSDSTNVLDDARKDQLNVVRSRQIRKFAQSFEDDKHLQFRATDLPEKEQAIMAAAEIQVVLILPIFADGRWWGCLGLDQSSSDQLWSKPEIDTFKATARVLGALLAHTNVEQQFRQFTGSIPAVFWIASPDVLQKTYVSPAYEQIWGRTRQSIRENRRSWMAAIYHDDFERVSALLERNPLDAYDLEYRVVRPDRSVRWIRDTAFPVRDSRGEVNRIVGMAQDITPQKEAEDRLRLSEERIRTSLNEKEVLLKEIHHRVKNNLQVISSLLSLQAGQIKDQKMSRVFKDSQTRVRAMALVHERIYKSSDLSRIEFGEYIKDMTNHLLSTYEPTQRVQLKLAVDRVFFDIETAIPCALIINELVSNSLKYAFPKGRAGEIRVQLLMEDEGSTTLLISDDGVGLPENVAFESTKSLGLSLVHSLTKQLNGDVSYGNSSGAEFRIRFKPVMAGVGS